MTFKVIILNKNMNVIYNSNFTIDELSKLNGQLKPRLEVFKRHLRLDKSCSLRIIPFDDIPSFDDKDFF